MTQEAIAPKIYAVRDEPVVLDGDLTLLYGVETRVFNQAVRRNQHRFPADFAFQLSKKEWSLLRSQIVTLKAVEENIENISPGFSPNTVQSWPRQSSIVSAPSQ